MGAGKTMQHYHFSRLRPINVCHDWKLVAGRGILTLAVFEDREGIFLFVGPTGNRKASRLGGPELEQSP